MTMSFLLLRIDKCTSKYIHKRLICHFFVKSYRFFTTILTVYIYSSKKERRKKQLPFDNCSYIHDFFSLFKSFLEILDQKRDNESSHECINKSSQKSYESTSNTCIVSDIKCFQKTYQNSTISSQSSSERKNE